MFKLVVLQICILFGTFQIPEIYGKHAFFDKTIVGGIDAQPGEAKFQVQIRQFRIVNHDFLFYHWKTEETLGFCGGVLLDSLTVLTAAHCVGPKNQNINLKVRYGTHQLGNSQYPDIVVSEARVHPDYNKVINDLAILKLSSKVRVGEESFVSLERTEIPSNSRTTIYGWGIDRFIFFQGQQPNNLKKGTLFTFSNSDCQNILNRISSPKFPPTASNSLICASNNEQTACQGDSGGPMILNSDGKLVGITSMVQDGCNKGGFNIYVKVSHYHSWITENLN